MRGALLVAALLLPNLISAGETPPTSSAVCATDVTPSDDLQDFYPPGSIRRDETGQVVIELTVMFGESRPIDVRLIGKSGVPDLDSAALRIAKAFTIRTECLKGTVRRTVHFEKEPNPPLASGTDYIPAGPTWIWVED